MKRSVFSVGDVAILFAGATLPLCLAPFGWWWFAPLPLVAYLWLTQNISRAHSYWRSFLFGLGTYGTGTSWIYVSVHDYGPAPAPLAALLIFLFSCFMALFFLFPMWIWHRYFQHKSAGILFGFPAAWVLDEWFRSWVFTGFPWLYVGYSQTETIMGNWAPLTGVYGISLWLALLASTIFFCIQNIQQKKYLYIGLPVLAAAISIGGGSVLGKVQWSKAVPGLQQSFALVQGNVPQQMKWKPEQREAIRKLYRDLSTPLWKNNFLVVWPEAAIPELYTPAHPFFSAIETQLATSGGALVTGIPTVHYDEEDEPVFHNSLLGLGEASGFYHKQRLVPFGEYVPLQQWLKGLLDFFKMPISDFQIGPANQPNISSGMMNIASSICYEVAYPELVAAQAGDADVLLTISNDTWFGASIGPHQHLQMAQMRARENAREMLRATSNGISAHIGRNGHLLSRSPQFEQYVLQGTAQAYRGRTPYQQWGNWPVLFICFVLLLLTATIKNANKP
jgi:apolipoprotein N-acyltransferase